MRYPISLMISSVVMVVALTLSAALSIDRLSLIAFVVPFFFLSTFQMSFWLIFVGLLGFAYTLPIQPISISVSVWMIVPAFALMVSKKRNWQVTTLTMCVVFSMEAGLVLLQNEGKLDGSPADTLLQICSVVLIWFGAYCWKGNNQVKLWPSILIVFLLFDSLQSGLFALSGSVLVFCLQELKLIDLLENDNIMSKLVVILPAIAFCTLIVLPQFTVPNPVFVAWIICLMIVWLGEYLNSCELEENKPD